MEKGVFMDRKQEKLSMFEKVFEYIFLGLLALFTLRITSLGQSIFFSSLTTAFLNFFIVMPSHKTSTNLNIPPASNWIKKLT